MQAPKFRLSGLVFRPTSGVAAARPLRIALAMVVLLASRAAFAASGLFPKMPPANTVYVVDASKDGTNARMTAWALQGLVNQGRAEAFVVTRAEDEQQLSASGKPAVRLPALGGDNSGLRTLFGRYQGQVRRMFVYDPQKDWTFYLALMASAQQGGIPVSPQIQSALASEFGWRGQVVDFRNYGNDRVSGYDWALVHLMPGCSRKVVFVLDWSRPLIDYAAASKGFIFWLDFKKDNELAEAKKIFATNGYTVGTSLMGYANIGDDANIYANPRGIGYVVSDYYSNGSFWSSFPNKTYSQPLGSPVKAMPGKVYVALNWSDGDNLSFDQQRTYRLWNSPGHGSVPISTSLSPTLQELNSPLLDWYYSKMTRNDQLIAGPSGVQFIFGDDYAPDLLPAWCRLSGDWTADAGFHAAYFWNFHYPSPQYQACSQEMNLNGVFHSDSNHFNNQAKYDTGIPVIDGDKTFSSPAALYNSLASIQPNPSGPTFLDRDVGVQGFGDNGYAEVQQVVQQLNAAYPGRYVFLLTKDFFATVRNYYRLAPAPMALRARP
jgi:hypothetical protein